MHLLSLICISVFAGQIRPYYIEVESPASSFNYSLSTINELELPVAKEQVHNLKIMQDYHLKRSSEGYGAAGKIHLLDRHNRLKSVRFWQVRDREQFRKMVEAQRYDGEVRWDGDRVSLIGRSLNSLNLPNEWAIFHNGLVIWDSIPEVHKVDLRSLSEWVAGVEKCHFACRFDPSGLPDTFRQQLFTAIERAVGVAVQRRDGESETHALTRRIVANTALRVASLAVADLKSAEIAITLPMPDDDSSWKCELKVEARRKSELADLIREIPLSNGSLTAQPAAIFASLELHCAIPDFIRKTALEQIGNQQKGAVAAALKKLLFDSDSRLEGVLVATNDSIPELHGALRLDADLRKQIGAEQFFQVFSQSFYPRLRPEIKDYRIACDTDESVLRFACSPKPDPEKIENSISTAVTKMKLPMARFKLNLAESTGWQEPDSNIRHLIDAIEEAYEEFLEYRLQAAFRQNFTQRIEWLMSEVGQRPTKKEFDAVFRKKGRQLAGEFTSITPKEGDWTSTGYVTVSGNSLVGKLSIGRELHRHIQARQLSAIGRSMQRKK